MAIIDSMYCDNMPPSLTANTGYDALVHAIESYVSIVSTDYTRGLSIQAIKMIVPVLPIAYAEPHNTHAREQMHNASGIAGMAFANAFLGICHSMAHQLGALFHLPHGLCNALFLSHVIKFNATNSPTKMASFPQYKFPQALRDYAQISEALNLPGENDIEKVNSLLAMLEDLKTKIGIKEGIKSYGILWEDYEAKLDELASMAFDDQCTGANPRYPLISELRKLFADAYHGPPQPLQPVSSKL